jgi:beta-lactamase class A
MKRLVLLFVAASLAAADPALQILEREIARVSKVAGGIVGATALHLESGRRVSLHGRERFPMASSYKVPIAVELLTRVDRGDERLDRMITLQPGDLHPGSGTLSDLFNKPGVSLSIRNLLELMLLISDNSATDVLLRVAGGGEAVTARMRALGIDGIRVDRPTARLIADSAGATLPPESEWSPETFRQAMRGVSEPERRAAAQRFNTDPRDTSTPDGMVALLERIYKKDLLKPDSAALLLDIMYRCRTGNARLKGILPTGTEVAHKTGTLGSSASDVGIITLPDNAGHVAIAAFVKVSDQPPTARERGIAEVARAVHDFFLFNRAEPRVTLNYEALAARIIDALRLSPGERVLTRFDPGHFVQLVPALRSRIRRARAVDLGAVEYIEAKTPGEQAGRRLEKLLEMTDVYLWLPLTESKRQVSKEEAAALVRWLDKGGARREIHFHWDLGSVLADGLTGPHPPENDAVYQQALDLDYEALSRAQDFAIQRFRAGTVRVRTPAGTDISFRVGDRPFNKQDGDASPARMKSARVRVDREIELPAGVLRVAPLEDTANGRIVVPEARFSGSVARNVRFEIQSGRVTTITADENQGVVEAALEAGGDAARRFREFGLGFNSKLPGLAYFAYGAGAVRLSLGDNEELGGAIRGGFRRWFFFPDATVVVDGRTMVRDGKLVLD